MLDVAARLVFFPVLFWQGVKVRRSALRLPEPIGQRIGVKGNGPFMRLLIVGDSSAAGVGTTHLDEALSGHMLKRLCQTNTVHWCVNAKIGAKTSETLNRLSDAQPQKYDLVSVSLGVNDITGLVPLRIWLWQYAALLDLLEQKFEADVICVSGIPQMKHFPLLPQPLRWVLGSQAARFDRALGKLIKKRSKCRFVMMDFEPDTSLMSPDGFHPGPKIYAEWGRKVYQTIRNDVSQFTMQ